MLGYILLSGLIGYLLGKNSQEKSSAPHPEQSTTQRNPATHVFTQKRINKGSKFVPLVNDDDKAWKIEHDGNKPTFGSAELE